MPKSIATKSFTLVAGDAFGSIKGYGVGYAGQWIGTIDGETNANNDENLFVVNGYGLNTFVVVGGGLLMQVNNDAGIAKFPEVGDTIPFLGATVDGVYHPIDQTSLMLNITSGIAGYEAKPTTMVLTEGVSYEMILHYYDNVKASISRAG
jgi:hypothetical protein